MLVSVQSVIATLMLRGIVARRITAHIRRLTASYVATVRVIGVVKLSIDRAGIWCKILRQSGQLRRKTMFKNLEVSKVVYRVIEVESYYNLTEFVDNIFNEERALEICGELQDDNPGLRCVIQRSIDGGAWENC